MNVWMYECTIAAWVLARMIVLLSWDYLWPCLNVKLDRLKCNFLGKSNYICGIFTTIRLKVGFLPQLVSPRKERSIMSIDRTGELYQLVVGMCVCIIVHPSSEEKTPKEGCMKVEFTCISSRQVSKVKYLVWICITVAPCTVERDSDRERQREEREYKKYNRWWPCTSSARSQSKVWIVRKSTWATIRNHNYSIHA